MNEQGAELKQLAETSTPSVHVLIGTLSVLLHVAVQPLTTVDSRYRLSKMIGDLIKIVMNKVGQVLSQSGPSTKQILANVKFSASVRQ